MNAPRHRPLGIGPLRAFQAVGRLLSFRGAAEELHLTQSAISRQIQSLEEELGAPLSLRGTRHVELRAAGAGLMAQSRQGQAPPLCRAADLAQHTLLEEDDHRPSAQYLSWRYWLRHHGQAQLQPQRWIYLNFTYQQIQAALAGQGVALA